MMSATTEDQTELLPFDASTDAIAKIFSIDTADVRFAFPSDEDSGIEPNPQQIAAHKTLLSALSPVFAAMFSGNWKESPSIDILDSSFDAFKAFLQYNKRCSERRKYR